ncbi:MAG: S41 family peptidase [Candidatus Obscuribacterales bacterium]|nr:S41 family peptidase [Steroidobacteraceae bacterium]
MLHRLRTATVLGIGVALGLSLSLAHQVFAAKTPLPWREARLFAEVFERISASYVDQLPDRRLAEFAVRGMVGALDPHSGYLDAKEFESLRIDTSGEYAGVGVEISLEDGNIKVLAAIDDSPAARAGVQASDIIVAIDDTPVDAEHLTESVERMRGKPGTRVSLTVMRAQSPLLTFALTRSTVQVHSVKQQRLEPGYGYVRISQFSSTTAQDFSAALSELQRNEPNGLQGLVLDLRDNPGGVLEAATDVADSLLNEGVIVTADGRSQESHFAIHAQKGDALRGAPIVVLVNSASASASEILAGALKDHKRAELIGQNTYGKGSVQTVMPLSDGGALKLTTSRYLTPSGASIQRSGIAPDVAITDLKSMAPPIDTRAIPLLRTDGEVRVALARLKRESK